MTLTTRLFVGNLPDNFSENFLKDVFSSYGEITNFDLKCKPGVENDKKRFAFITISASNFNVESCIKYFSNEDFHGTRLYVTRARESFLERLQREREQTHNKITMKPEQEPSPYVKTHVAEHQHSAQRRRQHNDLDVTGSNHIKKPKTSTTPYKNSQYINNADPSSVVGEFNDIPQTQSEKRKESDNRADNFQNDEKKQNSDQKRMESMRKKKQEFLDKKNIIKTGLISIDKPSNRKVIFSDAEEDNSLRKNSTSTNGHVTQKHDKTKLFDEGGSDEDINFNVKEQYEGKKGQKVLDLQSRYKSDKRFALDERFVEDSGSEGEEHQADEVDLNQAEEKAKQLDILQDVLDITIRPKTTDTSKTKTKLGMLRYDPTQPEHAKYVVQAAAKEPSKKKKSKDTKKEETPTEQEPVVEKVEVSKEQFYKISDTLKDGMTQPNTFSLRSLFTKQDNNQQEDTTEDIKYIPLKTNNDVKVKNPLDPGEKNPFVYDSSESENEEETHTEKKTVPSTSEVKTVWREKLFFSITDNRLKDGLFFFTKPFEDEYQKERRGLKSLMKKRIYNKERKNTMFQKKIGGRKKSNRNFRNN